MTERLLLCRPQGGLNDTLSQIEACCRYGEQTNRIVIVDTNYAGSHTFHDELGKISPGTIPMNCWCTTLREEASLRCSPC